LGNAYLHFPELCLRADAHYRMALQESQISLRLFEKLELAAID
jgi:hypothetical protein